MKIISYFKSYYILLRGSIEFKMTIIQNIFLMQYLLIADSSAIREVSFIIRNVCQLHSSHISKIFNFDSRHDFWFKDKLMFSIFTEIRKHVPSQVNSSWQILRVSCTIQYVTSFEKKILKTDVKFDHPLKVRHAQKSVIWIIIVMKRYNMHTLVYLLLSISIDYVVLWKNCCLISYKTSRNLKSAHSGWKLTLNCDTSRV